jgi:hypothetical protein
MFVNPRWSNLHSRCRVTLLVPPYRGAETEILRHQSLEIPLGAIVLGRSGDALAALAELTARVYHWPWVVPCILIATQDPGIESLVLLVSELRNRLVIARVRDGVLAADASTALAAVRRRSAPSADDLASWVTQRLGDPSLQRSLASQFGQALESLPASRLASRATFSRVFSRYGPYGSHDWRALGRLCMHCATLSAPWTSTGPPISVRAARAYSHKYLGLSYGALSKRIGWEWVLEGALRHAGYIRAEHHA